MKKFYFTYGSAPTFPFQGGWTLIYAPDLTAAIQIFKAYHPHPYGSSLVNCSDYYTEEDFEKDDTFKNGNRGSFCHEVIGPRNLIQDVGNKVYILTDCDSDREMSEPEIYSTHAAAYAAMLGGIAEMLDIEVEELENAADENGNISQEAFSDLFGYNGEVSSESAWVNDVHDLDLEWEISAKTLQYED